MNRRLGLALLVACTLVACGSTASAPSWFVSTYSGAPSGVTLTDGTPVAVWAATDQLAVVVWWSSSCPKLPVARRAAGNTLTLTLSSGTGPNGEPCTADFAPTTTVIRVPASVDQTRPLSITFVNDGSSQRTFVLAPRVEQGR